MQRILAAALFALFAFVTSAHAQSTAPVYLPGGCGTGNITNNEAYTTVNGTAQLCVNATVTASITGFTPNGSFATLTAAGTSGSVALPGGTAVAFQNTGTTAVSCTLGIGSAVALASEIIVQPASTVFVTPGTNTFGACIDQTGSTSNVVVLAGGAGLGTGFGGGGGGGSAITNYALETGGNLAAVLAAVTSQIPAGVNFIGQTGAWVPVASYVSGTTAAMTGTTSTQLLAAVATKKLYVLSISCVNSSATGTLVTVQDGSSGTALATLAAAGTFGGDEKTSVGPLFSTTAGNGLFVADVTTSGNVICNASGFAQ